MFGLDQGKEKSESSPVQGARWKAGKVEEFKIGSPRRLIRLNKLSFRALDLQEDEQLVIDEVQVTSDSGDVNQKFFFHQAITHDNNCILLSPSKINNYLERKKLRILRAFLLQHSRSLTWS